MCLSSRLSTSLCCVIAPMSIRFTVFALLYVAQTLFALANGRHTSFDFCLRYAREHLSNIAKETACRFQALHKLFGQSEYMQWRK